MALDISVTAQMKQKCVILLENSILQYRKTKYNIHHIYFTFPAVFHAGVLDIFPEYKPCKYNRI